MLRKEKRLKKQILLLITIVIVLIAGIRLYIDILNNKEVFENKVQLTIEQIQVLVSLEQKRITNFYASRAKHLLNNKKIIEAIKNRDRIKLQKLVDPNYKVLRKENKFFNIMHFHLADGSSFLRMHKPDIYGDDLSELRPMINYVHTTHKPVDGYEAGRMLHDGDDLQYRSVYPIFDLNDNYLGALEFGISSSQIISETLNIINYTHENHSNNIKIAILHSSAKLIHDHEHKNQNELYNVGPYNLAQHSDFFEHILEQEIDFSKDSIIIKRGTCTYLLQWNQVFFRDYNGNIDGTILVSFNISEDKKAYYISLIKSIMAPVVVLIVMLLFFNFGFNSFMKKLMKSHKDLALQHKFTQSLLDLQDNIIVTTDGLHILSANRSLLNFFNYDTLEDFSKIHDCICDFFIQHEGFFSLDQLSDDENWIDYLVNEQEEHKNVVSMICHQSCEPRAFSVKINKLDEDNHHYVIVFTDITDISIKSKEFEYRASHDALTKIYNRMKLNELFTKEIDLVKRYNNPLSIVMFDIDHFKVVNDTYGHLLGDKVLVELSSHIGREIRNTDIFARWGGEEFMLILPQTSLDSAKQLAQKLCDSIANDLSFGELKQITCSFGVTLFNENDTQDTVFNRVDEALYEAKDGGRNRVVVI